MDEMLKRLAQFLCTASGCVIVQYDAFGTDFYRDWNRAKTGFTWSLKLALYGVVGFFGIQMFLDIFSPFLHAAVTRTALFTCAGGVLLCLGWLWVVAAVRIGVPALTSNAFVAPNHGVSPTSSRFRALVCRLPGCYTCMNIERLKYMKEDGRC